MKAVTAFDLLMKCATARRRDNNNEMRAALDAVIGAFSDELRRILTPPPEDEEKPS